MLGRRNPQRSFFGAVAQLGTEVVEGMGFHGQLALKGNCLFKDEDFAYAYCSENGRPSVPPSMLAVARLLQHFDGVSDAEVVERCRFDLRWKVSLDLDAFSVDAPFAKSTYQAFRTRLTLHAKEGMAFERSVKLAREEGLLPKRLRVALDSSPVRGKGAVKDTFNLLSDAITAVIRGVAGKKKKKVEQIASESDLDRHVGTTSIKGSEFVDWDRQEDVSRFLEGLLEDCERVVDLADEADCAGDEVELLKKIINQNVDQESESDGSKVKRGVAKDRISSVTDPEMRHGRKSSGVRFNGHKAHVAVEESSKIITAVDVGSPGEADGHKVGALLAESATVTGVEMKEALGDCAYSTKEAQNQAAEYNVTLKSKMPSPPKGKFGPGAFSVSQDGLTVTCPAGYAPVKRYKSKEGPLHIWDPNQCQACPLKAKCTNAEKRSLIVRASFHDRRRREEWAQTEQGRTELRLRVVVEHAIGRLKNLGAGKSRFFGRSKTKSQWLWTAAVANLTVVWANEAKVSA